MKNGGQIPWNATPICETLKISCLMGRLHTERRCGEPFEGPIIPFGSVVECYPICAEDQSRIHVLPGLFLGYALHAEGIWKGDIMVAHVEELETMDASEIYAKRLNAKEVIVSERKWKIIFLSKMDESNFQEEIRS